MNFTPTVPPTEIGADWITSSNLNPLPGSLQLASDAHRVESAAQPMHNLHVGSPSCAIPYRFFLKSTKGQKTVIKGRMDCCSASLNGQQHYHFFQFCTVYQCACKSLFFHSFSLTFILGTQGNRSFL